MLLPAALALFFGAADVHLVAEDVYFRTEVPTTLGVVVNSTCDHDLFAAGVIGLFNNLYLGLDIASALKTKRLVPNLGDARTGTQSTGTELSPAIHQASSSSDLTGCGCSLVF